MPLPRLGFVGCGTIASAMVRGLATLDQPPTALVVSPRSAGKVASLKADFPGLVTVAESNQGVVDACDWVFLGVLPKQAADVVPPLKFRPDQTVCTLMAIVPTQSIVEWVAPVPSNRVFRAVPLPPVQHHACTTILTPPDDGLSELFDALGGTVQVRSEADLTTLQSITSLMGPFYELLRCSRDWAAAQGVDSASASKYVGDIFRSIAEDGKLAGPKPSGFDDLVAEQTPVRRRIDLTPHVARACAACCPPSCA